MTDTWTVMTDTWTAIVDATTVCTMTDPAPAVLSGRPSFLNVCLCDIEVNDRGIGDGPIPYAVLCDQHSDAVKLASLDNLIVFVHVKDQNGNCRALGA